MSFASESGHWYRKDGEPCYEVPNKSKGGMRKTNLRDAKTLGLVPSVTTILNILDKPGLTRWKIEQVAYAALTLPKIQGESLDDFLVRIYKDAEEHGRVAREEGTRIHGILEKHYLGEPQSLTDFDAKVVKAVEDKLLNLFGEQEWSAEKSFATDSYGGKVDLHSDVAVVDFKTKEFTENDKVRGWPEQCEQLAAYSQGLCLIQDGLFPRCVNLFISTSVPGLVHAHEWRQEDLLNGLSCFMATLNLWIEKKGYDPRGVSDGN